MKALLFAVVLIAAAPAEPSGYRMDDYNTPAPDTLHGAIVVNTEQALELWRAHQAVFIDVLPRPPKPAGLPASTIWHPKPRADIPGSIWLPDTGYGALAPVMQTYFEQGLQKATDGDPARPIVLYCKSDCWMSWNAAKRALALGYPHVVWYPEGTDGWSARDLPTEARNPLPRPATTE
jgi:PQQ-dependent catabolism-associated CXXCW motif protein